MEPNLFDKGVRWEGLMDIFDSRRQSTLIKNGLVRITRHEELIAVIFCAFWFIYAVLLLVTTFLFRPSLRIKVSRQNGVSVAQYELRNRETKNGKGQRQEP